MTNDIRERYRALNESFGKKDGRVLVWHLGIDAGFFAEYTYMLNAMLYCLKHKIEFRLYSADANFGSGTGWTEYFEPFCREEHHPLNHDYNYHRIPAYRELRKRRKDEAGGISLKQSLSLFIWTVKCQLRAFAGKMKARKIYGNNVLLNSDISFDDLDGHYCIPELAIDGNYLHAFGRLVEITWCFNAELQAAKTDILHQLNLPERYVSCQVRGGDKITEVALVTPERYVETFRENCPQERNVFLLTDDYRLYEQLVTTFPDYRFYTLCTKSESGYVNNQFTQTAADAKRKQMIRFLTSMELMQRSVFFVGSITTGPSFFLLKVLFPEGMPVDARKEDVPRAALLRIYLRGQIAADYLQKSK